MKLGTAYRERLAGDRPANREWAIVAFDNALLVRTPERNPAELCAARANLEALHRDRFGEWTESRITWPDGSPYREPTQLELPL